MDPKRKKIYIILIIVCFGASAAILAWNYFGSSNPPSVPVAANPGNQINPGNSTVTDTTGGIQDFSAGFTAPLVFPSSTDFDTRGVDSDTFKGLADYVPVNIDNQIGRDNPFKTYPK